MLRLTLAQMRPSLGRLTAAGVPIAMGTAFVAATLLAGAVVTRTSLDAVAASYTGADLVVTSPAGLPVDVVDAVREHDEVAAADGRLSVWTELGNGSRRVVSEVTALAADPRLDAQGVVEGRAPGARRDRAAGRDRRASGRRRGHPGGPGAVGGVGAGR